MPVCPQCRKENPELGAKCPRCANSFYVYDEAVADADEDSYIGQKAADKYVVIAQISEGGMGTVYRALQLPVEREVAFKVLRTDLEDNDEVRNRFTREARAVSKINHPNIITLHDFGFDASDYPYMVMEYAPGQDLDEWIYQRGITLERIVHVARQILSALADAHEQGIVHRDLKPENIVVTGTGTDDDFIKLLDFGIARLVNEQATSGLTREGEVFGTPHYMSPEQAEGETGIGPAADVYAAGIMMYEMLCREPPFDAPKPLSILFKQINEDLPDFDARAEVTIPDPLADVVRRATLKDPEARFQDAGEMLRALDRLADPDSSNIIEVPDAALQANANKSNTMVGTGARRVPENKEQREEVATANTLGFDDADASASGELERLQSGEAKAGAPEGATLWFDDDQSDRNTKIAVIGGAAFLVVAGFGVLLATGGAKDSSPSAGKEGDDGTQAAVTGSADTSASSKTEDTGIDGAAPPTEDAGVDTSADAGDDGTSGPARAERDDEPSPRRGESGSRTAGTSDESTGAGGTAAAADGPTGGSRAGTARGADSAGTGEPSDSTEPSTATESGSSGGAEEESESDSEEETKLEKFGAPEESPDDSEEDSQPDKFAPPGE